MHDGIVLKVYVLDPVTSVPNTHPKLQFMMMMIKTTIRTTVIPNGINIFIDQKWI